MEDYKEINKQLVKMNQQIKVEIAIYQKELISLKRQLFNERETRILREQTLRAMLVQSFKKTIAVIDPDCAIINMLQDNVEGDENCELPTSPQRRTSTSQILQELRHSNSLQRRSSILISPIRRSLSHMSVSNIYSPEMIEQQMDISNQEMDLAEQETDTIEQQTDITKPSEKIEETMVPLPQELSCIEEDKIETDSESDSEPQVAHKGVRDCANGISSIQLQKTPESPPIRVLGRRKNVCRPLPRSPLHDNSNLSTPCTSAHSSNVVINRGKSRSFLPTSASELSCSASMEPMRHAAEIQILLNDKPFSKETKTGGTLMELSEQIDYSQLSISHIAYAPSSTPNHTIQKSDVKEPPTTSATIRSRPKRSCKPQNLKERSISGKLRNENVTTPKKTNCYKKKKK